MLINVNFQPFNFEISFLKFNSRNFYELISFCKNKLVFVISSKLFWKTRNKHCFSPKNSALSRYSPLLAIYLTISCQSRGNYRFLSFNTWYTTKHLFTGTSGKQCTSVWYLVNVFLCIILVSFYSKLFMRIFWS